MPLEDASIGAKRLLASHVVAVLVLVASSLLSAILLRCAIHGGCHHIRKKQRCEPLAKVETLQTAIAKFKARIRKVARRCTKEEDEMYSKVSYARENRLQSIAISNKHAGIVGMPIIKQEEAELIMKAILAMRGINQKKHKIQHEEGALELLPRPMAYKGTAHAWLRNLGKMEEYEDWTGKARNPEEQQHEQEELKDILCPQCMRKQCTKQHTLNGKAGFSQIKCQTCEEVSTAGMWRCMCGIRWYKCGKHVPKTYLPLPLLHFPSMQSNSYSEHSTRISKLPGKGTKSKRLDHGVDMPMPKRKRLAGTFFERTLQVETDKFLFLGSTLAQRFPRSVK